MKPRMFCTECRRTAQADTLLEGSDRVEMFAWCCFAVPGWLYCWWRHALRIKLCAFCGSGELVREARAAAARSPLQAEPAVESRILPSSPGPRWPRALATPRDRLRHGGVLAALMGTWLVTVLPLWLEWVARTDARTAAHAASLACAGWLVYQAVRVSQRRATPAGCRAWDASGRPLQIEQVW